MSIRVTDWDEGVAWTGFAGYHPRDLERRLVRLTGGGRSEVKRLVRRLKNRDCFRLALSEATDHFAAESLRSLLESLGAAVKVENSDPNAT